MTWMTSLFGLLRSPDVDREERFTLPPQTPRVIPGGAAAPELCMLAAKMEHSIADLARDESDRRKRDVRVVQIKVDGIGSAYIAGPVVGAREGMPLDCALHCQPGLAKVEQALGEPFVLFGEYCADEGFNATLGEHRRGEGDGVFWLYDAVPHAAWMTGRPYEVAIEDRLARLRAAFLAAEPGLYVGLLDHWLLDLGETHMKAREVWAAGFEGLMSKRLGSFYVRGRSNDWFKVKRRFYFTCPVIDTTHKNGKLHSIIVRGPDKNGGGGVQPMAAAFGDVPPPGPGSKPVRITGGWSASEAESIDIGMGESGAGRIVTISFELTVGANRTVRAPKFERIDA